MSFERSSYSGSYSGSLGLLLALGLVLGSAPTLAETPGAVPPLETPAEKNYGIDGSLDFGKYGEDYFLTVGLGGTFSFSQWAFGIHAPLRIRIYDYDPGDEWYRTEDWDDVSDWFRILRFVQYGTPKDKFYARLGELVAATIGHGTIMSRYYNTLDIDHYYMGLRTNLNLKGGGFEFLTNDITYWNVTALRGFIRPFNLFMKEPHKLLQGIGVGITYAFDHSAPSFYQGAKSKLRGRLSSSTAGLETKWSDEFVYVLGIDVDWEVFRNDTYALTPYIDLNFFDSQGTGLHIGLLNELNILKSQFMLKIEYRLAGTHYAPNYFSSLYDIERWAFNERSDREDANDKPCDATGANPDDLRCGQLPKYYYYLDDPSLALRNGFYGELYANIVGLIGIGAIYEDYQGPDNASVTLRADLPEIVGIKMSAYYTRRNFDGWGEFFDLDKALLIAEARWKFYGPMYVYGLYASTWRRPTGEKEVEREDSWHFGIGASYAW